MATSNNEVYVAKLPTCIYCKFADREQLAEYDGATKKGPWAFMCGEHFAAHGVGLGVGVGQHLLLATGK